VTGWNCPVKSIMTTASYQVSFGYSNQDVASLEREKLNTEFWCRNLRVWTLGVARRIRENYIKMDFKT
jgi:hypothetical protein